MHICSTPYWNVSNSQTRYVACNQSGNGGGVKWVGERNGLQVSFTIWWGHLYSEVVFSGIEWRQEITVWSVSVDTTVHAASFLWRTDSHHQENRVRRVWDWWVMVSYFYIVKGSTTTDPDILSHEVKRYKLRIPPFIRVWIGDDCVR